MRQIVVSVTALFLAGIVAATCFFAALVASHWALIAVFAVFAVFGVFGVFTVFGVFGVFTVFGVFGVAAAGFFARFSSIFSFG